MSTGTAYGQHHGASLQAAGYTAPGKEGGGSYAVAGPAGTLKPAEGDLPVRRLPIFRNLDPAALSGA